MYCSYKESSPDNGMSVIERLVYSYFEKGCRRKCARDNPERYYGIWSMHCSWHWSCRTYFFLLSLALANNVHGLSCNSFKFLRRTEWTQNHPQYLSGLSRALFPTTFLEIAAYELSLLSLLGRARLTTSRLRERWRHEGRSQSERRPAETGNGTWKSLGRDSRRLHWMFCKNSPKKQISFSRWSF